MARRGGSRSSRKRKAARREARLAAQAVQPSRVSTATRSPSVVVRVPVEPARRLSDLYPVNPRKLAKPARAVVRKPAPLEAVNPDVARRRPLPASIKAFRAAQLNAKPGAASGKSWRETAAQSAARDNATDKNKMPECQPRPERTAKAVGVSGVPAPRKFVNWCG